MLLRHNFLFKFAESRTYRISADKPNRGEGEAHLIDEPVDLTQLSQVGMFPLKAPAEVECLSASAIRCVL
jgi:hypothetical protein